MNIHFGCWISRRMICQLTALKFPDSPIRSDIFTTLCGVCICSTTQPLRSFVTMHSLKQDEWSRYAMILYFSESKSTTKFPDRQRIPILSQKFYMPEENYPSLESSQRYSYLTSATNIFIYTSLSNISHFQDDCPIAMWADDLGGNVFVQN